MTSRSSKRRNSQASYRCSSCGFATGKWMGFCPQCRSEGSLVESIASGVSASQSQSLREIPVGDKPRTATGINEIDRVLGGGLVAGSVVLVGGEPGVGKSTLLLLGIPFNYCVPWCLFLASD